MTAPVGRLIVPLSSRAASTSAAAPVVLLRRLTQRQYRQLFYIIMEWLRRLGPSGSIMVLFLLSLVKRLRGKSSRYVLLMLKTLCRKASSL